MIEIRVQAFYFIRIADSVKASLLLSKLNDFAPVFFE